MMENRNKRPKISIVVSDLTGKGGIETVISYIGHRKKINDFFEITMFAVTNIPNDDWVKSTGIKSVRDTKLTNKIICLFRYVYFLIKYDGDALLVIGQKPTFVAKIIKKLFRKKYKIIFWSHFALRKDNGIVRDNFRMIKSADYYLAISTGIKEELQSQGIKKDRIATIFNPVAREIKTIEPDPDICRFIYVGRIYLRGQKNLIGILSALKQLNGKWEFEIWGSGPDMNEAKNIVNQDNNLKSKVSFKGWSNYPWEKIKQANALILNSKFEGLPMVVAESLSYGMPVIATDCPTGPSDLISPGVNGFLYKINDYNMLLKYLNDFVNHKENFNSKKIKESISDLYEKNYDRNFIHAINSFINRDLQKKG